MPDRTRHRRPGSARTRGVVACAAVLLAVLWTAGCSGPVRLAGTPTVPPGDAATCRTLISDLPDTVAGQDRRDVTPDDALGAAWGDPAIALVCGVAVPPDFTAGAACIRANGVDWFVPDDELFPDDPHTDLTMTAVGYRPVVQVFIPGDYRPEGLAAAMVEIGKAVDDDLDFVKPCKA